VGLRAGWLEWGRLVCACCLALTRVACSEGARSEVSADGALEPARDAGSAPRADADAGSGARACAASCGEAEVCCAGQCIDVRSDIDHCGECELACAAQQAEMACVDGACAIQQCAAGFVDCNGRAADGCEQVDVGVPSVPRLVSPMQGEYTGSVHAERSLRPSLRWAAPANSGTCGRVAYEIELDDSCQRSTLATCAFASAELSERGVTTTLWTPAQSLPVKAEVPVGSSYAWRVRACELADRCSSWSEVRYLHVGRLRDDLNGDGYSDVIALSRDGESTFRTLVVPGGTSLAGATIAPFEAPNDAFADVRFVGDVNGDGFVDAVRVQALALPDPVPDTPAFVAAALLLGGPVLADLQIVRLPERVQFLSVAALGDWDLDGFDDFAVGESTSTAEASATSGVRIYPGAASLDVAGASPITVPAATTPGAFGNELEGGFDFDADGHPDLAIMDGDDGRIHIVRGGPERARSVSVSLSAGDQCNYFEGARLARAGDMNGDGVSELAARCANRVLVYAGGRSPSLEPVWQFVVGEAGSFYGADIAGGFDLGQDGLADLLFHTRVGTTLTLVMLPGSSALGPASEPVSFGGNFSEAALEDGITVGDHDGDGRFDVIVPVDFPLNALRRFSGAAAAPAGAECSQPSSSFELVGNWCDAASEDVEDTYRTPAGDERVVGDSFGFTLAR
jgi:hypothetical protein